jgi:hypothetical protein
MVWYSSRPIPSLWPTNGNGYKIQSFFCFGVSMTVPVEILCYSIFQHCVIFPVLYISPTFFPPITSFCEQQEFLATSFALFTFLYSLFSEILNSHQLSAAWYATTATKMTPHAVSWKQTDISVKMDWTTNKKRVQERFCITVQYYRLSIWELPFLKGNCRLGGNSIL